MEKLLNIKEAADFLNVSEMSLRRWTNAGKLKCYRLGGKNERRFTRQELENLLQSDEKNVPLGISSAAVNDSSHIAHFYKDSDESVVKGSEFLQKGLSRGESILIISTKKKSAQILAKLNDLGLPVDRLRKEGLIVISNGRSSFDEQLRFMTDIITRCPHDKGLRLLGDMIWAIDKGWDLKQINRLETKTNQALTGNNRIFLCQYDLTRFGADGAMMAFDTHSHTVYRGEVRQSPYFTKSVV